VVSISSAPTTTDADPQTELWWEHAAAPGPGSGVGSAPTPAPDSSSEPTGGRWAQGEELLCLVTELLGGGSRLRGIRESRRETDC